MNNVKAMTRYCRLMEKPPTWKNMHRRRQLYDAIMDDMDERLRVFCVFCAAVGAAGADDLLTFAQWELSRMQDDVKDEKANIPLTNKRPTGDQLKMSAAQAEELIMHGSRGRR